MTATKSYYSATSLKPDVQLVTSKEEDYPAAVLTHNVNEEQQDQEHGKLSTASNSTVSTLLRNTALDPISAEGRERQAARSPGLIRLIAEMDTSDVSSEQGVDGKKGRDYLSPLSLSRTETFSGTFYNNVTEDYDTDLEIELEVSNSKKSLYQDTTGKEVYLQACRHFEIIPTSYFVRNISSPKVLLGHHGLGPVGIKAMVISLIRNTKITVLDLHDNGLTDEGGKVMAQLLLENYYITDLNLSQNGLGLETAKAFGETFEGNGTLKTLDLSRNCLCDKSVEYFHEGLINNYNLSELNLSKNQIGARGGKTLGEILKEQRSVVTLDLSWNNLGSCGVDHLLKGLKDNIMLKNLNLAWNAIGAEGSKAVSRALGFISVTSLDISNNRLELEGAKFVARGIRKNSVLKTLKIGHNRLENDGATVILNSIQRSSTSTIETLDLSGTDLEERFQKLAQKLKAKQPKLTIIDDSRLRKTLRQLPEDPRTLLKKYLDDNHVHLVDLFNFIDHDRSTSISVEEFRKGLKKAKSGLADFQIDELMLLLDVDGDGEIDYGEFSSL